MIVKELFEAKSIKWVHPNFNYEFNEVKHQTGIRDFYKTKKQFLNAVSNGKHIKLSKKEVDSLLNHTSDKSDWHELEDEKKVRVEKLFKKGTVELPIVLVDKDHDLMYLLSGNTRLNYSSNNGYGREVWAVNAPDLENFL